MGSMMKRLFFKLRYRFSMYITIIIGFFILFNASIALGAQTVIIKVIEERQEKRESTRWTLTEWLRIKERMKMMDVWLAMFSPKQPEFTPELNLNYGRVISNYSSENYEARQSAETKYGASMWLTNIVSASTGIRTLNIDLGFSTKTTVGEKPFNFMPKEGKNVSSLDLEFKPATSEVGVDFRVLGSHSQDTSLVYTYARQISKAQPGYDDSFELGLVDYVGASHSLLLKVYLFSWLGLEASLLKLDAKSSNLLQEVELKQEVIHYGAFLEVSLIRFEYSVYDSSVTYGDKKILNRGYLTGVALQI